MPTKTAFFPPTSQRGLTPFAWNLVAGIACLVLAMGAYWSVLLNGYRTQQRETEAQTWLRVGQISHAVSVQVQTLLSGLDYTLQSLAIGYAAGDGAAFRQMVTTVFDAYPSGVLVQVAVADAGGDIVYSNLAPPGGPQEKVSIRDREHFQAHAERRAAGMFVGTPVQGRLSRQWTIQLSRPLLRGGEFDGVVVLSLSPDYIARYFRAILDGPGDIISLLRTDGTYLARTRQQDAVLGRAVPPERLHLFEPQRMQGTYDVEAPPDGVRRLYAWSRVPDQPLIVAVGLDRHAVFGPFQATVARSLVRNGVTSALILLGALLTVWLAVQRERSERLRLQGERRFARLAQEVPGGLFQSRMDEAGDFRLLFTTPGFFEVHGLPPAAGPAGEAGLASRVHPADLPALAASVRASMATQGLWDHKYRVRHPGGGLRWLHGHARPQREDDGTLLWYGYVHDVTQDQALQEAIRRSEERLRATVQAVRDGLWQWDCESGRVEWDARCYQMLGFEDGAFALLYEDFLARIHPADGERVRERLRRHLELGEEFRVEMRLRTAENGWLHVESRGEVSERDARGRPLHMLGTHTDIQQRVEQGRMLKALIDRGGALVMVATPGRDILYANERAAQVFGLQAGRQPPGLSFRLLHDSDEGFARFAALYDRLQAEGSVRVEWALRLPSGDPRWFDMQGTQLDPEDGDGGVIWTLIDTDARRQRETRLETLALTDALTGIPNRRAFMERLDMELDHLRAGLVDAATLIMLDIDHFKRVNDTYGHAVGDVVLQALARVLEQELRKDDMVGRLGGEEFAALLSSAGAEAGYLRAERLREAVAAHPIAVDGVGDIRITISLGVYALAPDDARALACLERADAAMYFSKRNGRNRSTPWSENLATAPSPAPAAG